MGSELYTKKQIKKRFLGLRNERIKAEPGQAVVLVGRDGMTVLYPGQEVTAGESVWGAYDTAYIVDMGQRNIEVRFDARAKEGFGAFRMTVNAGYRVRDPKEVVNRRIQDPEPVIQRAIKDMVTEVASEFDIAAGDKARKAIRTVLLEKPLGPNVPFRLENVHVDLELDAKAQEFLRQRKEQEFQAELVKHSVETERVTAEKEQIRQQYALELERQRKEFELQLQKRKVEAELEIQQLRMEVYKPMIEGGMWSLLIQQLAQNPDDISKVTNLILEIHQQRRNLDLQMLQTLLQNDFIEEHDLQGIVRALIRNLGEGLANRTQVYQITEEEHKPLPGGEKEQTSKAEGAEEVDDVN